MKLIVKPSKVHIEQEGDLISSNSEREDFTLEKLAIQTNDRVLEVGFGLGYTLEKVSTQLSNYGELQGLDHSKWMHKQAMIRNHTAIQQGKVKLFCCDLWDFHSPEAYFNTIYTNNIPVFWENPVTEFRWLRELLKEGGKLLTIHQLNSIKSDKEIAQISHRLVGQYLLAGFENIEVDYREISDGYCIGVVGYK